MEHGSLFSLLSHSLITVSVIPDRDTAKVPQTKHFSPLNRVRAFKPTQFEAVIPELQQINQYGCGIFFTINEGDGLKDPDSPADNLNCGKRKNIQYLNTLVIDTDNADTQALDRALAELKLLPHVKVQSSPGRYHYYFLISRVPCTGNNVVIWQALQKHLATLVPDLDQSMSDVNQVLRIPGFYHAKAEPFLTSVVQVSHHAVYMLEDLYLRLAPKEVTPPTGPATYTKFEFPTGKLTEGNRRTTITRYIEHVMENVLAVDAPEQDYFVLIDAFIIKYLTPSDAQEFLEGGSRRRNIVQYFHDQKHFRLNKIVRAQSMVEEARLNALDAIAQQDLKDEFYLSMPGALGQIIKDFHRYAPKLPLELAFAGALFVLGALKADTYRYKGAWPLVNGLIIAGSGVGKSLIKTLTHEFLKQSGFRGAYSPLLGFQNTVQSLHTDLYAAGGVGVVMVDESGDYLQTITSRNAPNYARALKKYFKEATTAYHNGAHLSPGRSMSFQLPDIEYGMLGLWILIQPGMFESSLSSDDMGDGFLPRFLVFSGSADIDLLSTYNRQATKPYKLNIDLQVLAESYLQRAPYLSPEATLQLIFEAKQTLLAESPRAKAADIKAAQAEAVYRARSEARLMGPKIEVTLLGQGESFVVEYLQGVQREARKVQSADPESNALNIYIRCEEMINRLLCCVSEPDGSVSEESVIGILTWHKYMLGKFFSKHLPALETAAGERDDDELVKAVRRAMAQHGRVVDVREIRDALPGRIKRSLNVRSRLAQLVRDGELKSIDVECKGSAKGVKRCYF